MARRTSLAASSRASTDACSLYQDVCGVQIKLGASFRGPVEKLLRGGDRIIENSNEVLHCVHFWVYMCVLYTVT